MSSDAKRRETASIIYFRLIDHNILHVASICRTIDSKISRKYRPSYILHLELPIVLPYIGKNLLPCSEDHYLYTLFSCALVKILKFVKIIIQNNNQLIFIRIQPKC